MPTRWFGERIPRNEDPRLLTGRAAFVDDIRRPGLLHAAFVRSPHAHARILGIDTAAARDLPGVIAVFTAADLPERLRAPLPKLIPHPALVHHKTQVALAGEVVHHLGEPIALVVAESRYVAEDAVELVTVEFEVLPAVVDLEAAASPDSPVVHADMTDNIAAHHIQRVGSIEEAFARAPHLFRERLVIDRGASAPLETRGVVAEWDANSRELVVWDSTQAPIPVRNYLSDLLGLPRSNVRVVAPAIGGGFGPKIMMCYPEEIAIPFAAMALGRPVKWIEDRREHFVATNQERLQIHDAEIAVDDEGRILGVRTVFLHDCGAYCAYGLQLPIIASTTLPGPYKIPNYHAEYRAVFTTRTQTSPYRGAGRPHGVFVMERLMDRVARELGIDRTEVRRRNFIQPHEFPYDLGGLIYQDGVRLVYDSGNYPEVLRKALERIGYTEWPAQKARYRREGRRVGLGIAFYVEGTGIGPYEGCRITVEPSGQVAVATSVGTQGQGHYTTFAQIVADALGTDVTDVVVTTGDSGAFGWGTGTFASRAAVVAGNAVALAAEAVRQKALQVAATLLEARADDLELAGGTVFVRGVPGRAATLGQVAAAANPLRGVLPSDWEGPGLEATRYFAPSSGAYAAGCHAALVEVDTETGFIRFLRYVAVHDCGPIINPLILEGQMQGGVAQGIGNAFYERLVWDEQGQLLTQTFMDYLLPTVAEVPAVEIEHVETPSPLNPLGVKGAGEAGVIPVPAMVASAIDDALSEEGVRITQMPLDPALLRAIIQEARARPAPA